MGEMGEKMTQYGEKMWEKLERYAKMKKWLERDTNGNDILKLSIKSPSVSPLSPLLSPLIPSFNGIRNVSKFLLNLGMKCWNSAFNAQGSRVIIVVVQVEAVKISVAAVEALRKKKRQDEIQFTTKIGGKTHLGANYFLL